jgi:hypothetical protein
MVTRIGCRRKAVRTKGQVGTHRHTPSCTNAQPGEIELKPDDDIKMDALLPFIYLGITRIRPAATAATTSFRSAQQCETMRTGVAPNLFQRT